MNKLISKILDIIFPKRCVFCGKKLDTKYKICLCEKCKDVAFINKSAPRQFEKKFFENIICCMSYKGYARKCFLKYKFSDVRYYSSTYAEMIYFKIKNVPEYKNADFVTCVPLSEKRLKERGYNQSQLISHKIAELLNKPHIDDMLIKRKDTKPFSSLSVKERRRLVRGSYIYNDKYDITGKNIILIDDIYTSGATLNECSKVLKMYGANGVYCASLFDAELDVRRKYEGKNIHNTHK